MVARLPTDCLQVTTIADLISGRLSPAAIADAESHLRVCSLCVDLLAMAVSSAARDADTEKSIGRPLRAPTVLPAGTELGRYQVRGWIGRGGMGDVYEGFDPQLERKVAIKLLRERGGNGPGQSQSAQGRLEREARILARLTGSNVVAVLDIGTFGDRAFFVMELVEGQTLAAWLREAERTWRQILDRFLEAGDGLAAAHQVGIVHRDFKPQNVLIGIDGKARVSDFGLARAADVDVDVDEGALRRSTGASDRLQPQKSTPAGTRAAAGTPRYMAPEQFLREEEDARTDQFSFCVALFEALHGRHPFVGENEGQASPPHKFRDALQNGNAVSGFRNAKVPRSLNAILDRGLARSPTDRFGSMREMLAAIRSRTDLSFGRSVKHALAVVGVLVLGIAAVTLFARSHRDSSVPTISPAGKPADWTSARVVFRVSDRIHCLMPISAATIRVVWGTPRQAEDVDIPTGSHRPTDLLPETYRYGCPELSPDGHQLIYEGYDSKDRPQIFYSANPTGRDAEPIVLCVEPTSDSQPLWLRSSREFVFDLDFQHPAVFSIPTKTFTIIPDADRSGHSPLGFFKAVSRTSDAIGVIQTKAGTSDLSVNIYRWPALEVMTKFWARLETGYLNWHFGLDPMRMYARLGGEPDSLGVVDLRSGKASYLATVAHRDITNFLEVTPGTYAVVTAWLDADVFFDDAAGIEQKVPRETLAHYLSAAKLDDDNILLTRQARVEGNQPRSEWRIVVFRPSNRSFRQLTDGPWDGHASALSPSSWLMLRDNPSDREVRGIFSCSIEPPDGSVSCHRLSSDFPLTGPVAAPDGRRFAYGVLGSQSIVIRVASSQDGSAADLVGGVTECEVVWSGPTTLWFSRRVGRTFQWTEIDVLTKRETGRTTPGTTGCYDAQPDRNPPVRAAVRMVRRTDSEIRVQRGP